MAPSAPSKAPLVFSVINSSQCFLCRLLLCMIRVSIMLYATGSTTLLFGKFSSLWVVSEQSPFRVNISFNSILCMPYSSHTIVTGLGFQIAPTWIVPWQLRCMISNRTGGFTAQLGSISTLRLYTQGLTGGEYMSTLIYDCLMCVMFLTGEREPYLYQ